MWTFFFMTAVLCIFDGEMKLESVIDRSLFSTLFTTSFCPNSRKLQVVPQYNEENMSMENAIYEVLAWARG